MDIDVPSSYESLDRARTKAEIAIVMQFPEQPSCPTIGEILKEQINRTVRELRDQILGVKTEF